MLETAITTIVAAMVAGATAKLGEVASKAVLDTYEGLKVLIIRKFDGKDGAVQAVEDDPQSEDTQVVLTKALAKNGAENDPGLIAQAKAVENAVAQAQKEGVSGAGDINLGAIKAKLNTTIETLVASGSITIKEIGADEGDVIVRGLYAGGAKPK
jgi:hypothetical protein